MNSSSKTIPYQDYKKDANRNAHVKVFNATIRVNGKTFKKYIINTFNYTLKKKTSNWCHNYISNFSNYIFLKLT